MSAFLISALTLSIPVLEDSQVFNKVSVPEEETPYNFTVGLLLIMLVVDLKNL